MGGGVTGAAKVVSLAMSGMELIECKETQIWPTVRSSFRENCYVPVQEKNRILL